MTGENDNKVDFAALIDGVIERRIRTNFTLFLWNYMFETDGDLRRLTPSEVRLIRSATDGFLSDNSFAPLGMTEFPNLCTRLAEFAAAETDYVGDDAVCIRNACFDAMTCIKALEARLAKEVDTNNILAGKLTEDTLPSGGGIKF